MPIHTTQVGDSTIRLSEQYGLLADTIWNHPNNQDLKGKRKDMNVLMPGDKIFIPDKQIKQVEKPCKQRHTFKRKGIPAIFRLQLFDHEVPRKNQEYRMVIDGIYYHGVTDDQGILMAHIPAISQEGELTIGPLDETFQLLFSSLEPSDQISGIQQRLTNLGYYCGDTDGQWTPQAIEALTRFQARFKLDTTSKADAATLNKLTEIHDSPAVFPKEDPPEASV